jgi:hypothetical protein
MADSEGCHIGGMKATTTKTTKSFETLIDLRAFVKVRVVKEPLEKIWVNWWLSFLGFHAPEVCFLFNFFSVTHRKQKKS